MIDRIEVLTGSASSDLRLGRDLRRHQLHPQEKSRWRDAELSRRRHQRRRRFLAASATQRRRQLRRARCDLRRRVLQAGSDLPVPARIPGFAQRQSDPVRPRRATRVFLRWNPATLAIHRSGPGGLRCALASRPRQRALQLPAEPRLLLRQYRSALWHGAELGREWRRLRVADLPDRRRPARVSRLPGCARARNSAAPGLLGLQRLGRQHLHQRRHRHVRSLASASSRPKKSADSMRSSTTTAIRRAR